MNILANDVIHSDGRHNAFPSMVRWRDRFWIAFRQGANHRSADGRVCLIHSADLRTWSAPRVIVDSPCDDRDPTLFVHGDRLFVASLSIDREWQDPERPFAGVLQVQRRVFSLISRSTDGEHFSAPRQCLPDHFGIWWVTRRGDTLYAAVQKRLPSTGARRDCRCELWQSTDGQAWAPVAVIAEDREATESALALLEDERMVAFVRHDAADRPFPEIKIATPPYTDWRTLLHFDFWHNGPCLGHVGARLITVSRAFFEQPGTPFADALARKRVRGLLLGALDVDTATWTPLQAIPHHRGPRAACDPDVHEDASFNFPDISYASIVTLDERRSAMVYYEGYKGPPADLRLVVLAA